MSAIHVTAEVGRTYIMTNGERLVVTHTTAHSVVSRPEGGGIARGFGRTGFEREIESVLE